MFLGVNVHSLSQLAQLHKFLSVNFKLQDMCALFKQKHVFEIKAIPLLQYLSIQAHTRTHKHVENIETL